jgi:hypothetical protein
MWQALKPFRRLTMMVNPNSDHFGGGHGPSSGFGSRQAKRLLKVGVAAFTGGAAGAAAAQVLDDDQPAPVPERAEARPSPYAPVAQPAALTAATVRTDPSPGSGSEPGLRPHPGTIADERPRARVFEASDADHQRDHQRTATRTHPKPAMNALSGFEPRPSEAVDSLTPPPAPTEPEWYDGEAVYPIYRPAERTGDVA